MVIGDGIPVSKIYPVAGTTDDEKFNSQNHTKVPLATYFWFNTVISLN